MKKPLRHPSITAALYRFESHKTLPLLALALITLLAAVLRFYKLGSWSFWIDEVFTLNRALASLTTYTIETPISTLLIGRVVAILGTGEWAARLVPALLGVLSIPILYFPIRKLFGPMVALLAVLLLAISPFHIYWSQNARFYTALLLFYALSMFAFYFWMERNDLKWLAVALVLLGLATLERKMALYLFPAVIAYFFAVNFTGFGKKFRARWGSLALFGAPVAIFGAYETYKFLGPFLSNFAAYPSNPVRLFFSIVVDIGLPLFVLALLGGGYLFNHKSRAGLYLLVGILVPLVLILAISPFAKSESRYLFATLPAWAILGAVAVKELLLRSPSSTRLLALGALILVLADPLSQDVLYYGYQNGNRQEWKQAFELVQQQRQPGDQVVTTRPELAEYYLGRAEIGELSLSNPELGEFYLGEGIFPTADVSPKTVQAYTRPTWFVIDDRTAYISKELRLWLAENTGLKGVFDVTIPGKPMTMRVYYYAPGGQ